MLSMAKIGSISRIVFWEPSLSPHKLDLMRGLLRLLPETEILYVAEQGVPKDRLEMGWSAQSVDRVVEVIAPDSQCVERIVGEHPNSTFHIFSGIRWVPTITSAIRHVRAIRAPFAIMSEPRDSAGARGLLRYVHSWITEGWFRRNCKFVLAIGRNGPSWFSSVGYPSERIFPFAYFLPRNEKRPEKSCQPYGVVRVAYAGRLVHDKGVHDLVIGLGSIADRVQLTILGDGPKRLELQALAESLRLNATFLGTVPMRSVSTILEEVDVLVLPSVRKDGWGAVVSEALLAGCAAVATPEVGASVLLTDISRGLTIPRDSPGHIAAAIELLRDAGALTQMARLRRQAWAQSCLSGDAGADYLVRILRWSLGERRPLPFFESHQFDGPSTGVLQ